MENVLQPWHFVSFVKTHRPLPHLDPRLAINSVTCLEFYDYFIKIDGKQHYLWRAVDQNGEVVDVFLQKRRYGAVAKRLFKRLLKKHKDEPRKIVTSVFIYI